MWCCLPEVEDWFQKMKRKTQKQTIGKYRDVERWERQKNGGSDKERVTKIKERAWKGITSVPERAQAWDKVGWVIRADSSHTVCCLDDFCCASCANGVIWNEALNSSDRPVETHRERGRIINVMQRVLPEKEVPPPASANSIILLETGT